MKQLNKAVQTRDNKQEEQPVMWCNILKTDRVSVEQLRQLRVLISGYGKHWLEEFTELGE